MISISLWFFLIPYGFVLVLFALYAAFTVWHFIRHGATTGISFLATFAFLGGAACVLFLTSVALQGTDWQQQITLSSPLVAAKAPSL